MAVHSFQAAKKPEQLIEDGGYNDIKEGDHTGETEGEDVADEALAANTAELAALLTVNQSATLSASGCRHVARYTSSFCSVAGSPSECDVTLVCAKICTRE